MLKLKELIYGVLIPMLPVVVALSCSVNLWLLGKDLFRPHKDKIRLTLLWFYLFVLLGWASATVYAHLPSIFARIHWLCYIIWLLSQVMLFRFVWLLTDTGENKKFPIMHYILPVAIGFALLLWSQFVPPGIQEQLTLGRGRLIVAHYPIYSVVFQSKSYMRLLYSIVYSILSFLRMRRYKKEIANYSADTDRSTLAWLSRCLVLSIVMIVFPFMLVLFGNAIFDYGLIAFPVIAVVVSTLLISLCHHTLRKDYVLIEENSHEATSQTTQPAASEDEPAMNVHPEANNNKYPTGKLQKDSFEAFMAENKPYLNPNLKITDLSRQLSTNRMYLSTFINATYNLNFNQYINRCRLNEYYRLLTDPTYAEYKEKDLSIVCGFGSYRNYTRAKSIWKNELAKKQPENAC